MRKLLICIFLISILMFTVKADKQVIKDPLPLASEEFRQKVEEVTFGWKYTRAIEPHKFDCSDTSQITWYILSDFGFDPKIMVGQHDGVNHMWLAVPDHRGNWAMVECAFVDLKVLGITVDENEYCTGTMYDDPFNATAATGDKLWKNERLPIERTNFNEVLQWKLRSLWL